MVFHSNSESETPKRRVLMASSETAPAKSQPLHNFSLPQWKWSKSHASGHHRGRRLAAADSGTRCSPPPDSAAPRSPAAPQPRDSPAVRGYVFESESAYFSALKNGFACESRRSPAPESSRGGGLPSVATTATSDRWIENWEKRKAVFESDVSGGVKERSKILIRLPANNKPAVTAADDDDDDDDDVQDEGRTGSVGDRKASPDGEIDEFSAKTWNLRPRKAVTKLPNSNGGTLRIGGTSLPENKAQPPQAGASNRSETSRLRSSPDTNRPEKENKKQKFSISLSRREIEEDIFSITGSKPARRPKKRSKTVQKQLENVFPGMWLASITPDSYKVSEAPVKG